MRLRPRQGLCALYSKLCVQRRSVVLSLGQAHRFLWPEAISRDFHISRYSKSSFLRPFHTDRIERLNWMVTESKRQSVFYPHGCNFKNLCSMGLPAVILGVSDFQSHPESGLGNSHRALVPSCQQRQRAGVKRSLARWEGWPRAHRTSYVTASDGMVRRVTLRTAGGGTVL